MCLQILGSKSSDRCYAGGERGGERLCWITRQSMKETVWSLVQQRVYITTNNWALV